MKVRELNIHFASFIERFMNRSISGALIESTIEESIKKLGYSMVNEEQLLPVKKFTVDFFHGQHKFFSHGFEVSSAFLVAYQHCIKSN